MVRLTCTLWAIKPFQAQCELVEQHRGLGAGTVPEEEPLLAERKPQAAHQRQPDQPAVGTDSQTVSLRKVFSQMRATLGALMEKQNERTSTKPKQKQRNRISETNRKRSRFQA